ncbi:MULTISPECIES: PRC-barrel domain-containing protein [unclassified Roseitalea]|uniref:PRC-barrel domain-containing protein n=1 Tax=unclassified Roseitalea TaxID=2639107 RepID=UPI00273DA020|nr:MULTISPECIES: PRC-barrel domain-containing protein [unclassified Roseitalea]
MAPKLAILTVTTALVAAPAAAQNAIDPGEVVPLGTWNTVLGENINGVSVRRLNGSDVNGEDGEEIGTVEDIIVGPDGQVISIIAEVGGFWDIGDQHINVPWEEVTVNADADDNWFDTQFDVRIPVNEDNVTDFDLFGDDSDPITAGSDLTRIVDDADFEGRAWRTSELIGDFARLAGGDGEPLYHGYVYDMIIRDGEVVGTIINARYPGGYYAYPSYAGRGYGWAPGSPYYDLPYTEQDVAELQPLDAGVYD